MRFFLLLSLPLYLLDQATKFWVLQRFPDYPSHEFIEVVPGFFHIVRVHNTGMAFGVLNNYEHANWIFGIIAVAAVAVIAVFWRKGGFPDRISKVAAALLIAGILGNLTDRILPGRGYVVDFLDFQPPLYGKLFPSSGGHFPSFNVADSCICIAAALLIIASFRQAKQERAALSEKKSEP
ncbi:MAG: signal peptidase II [Verrucomicrobiales bacterium]